MKKLINVSVLFCLMFLFAASAGFAQQWSNEQKEVWSDVQKYWDASSSGDAQGFLKYFDDSYMGWSYRVKAPMNRANTAKWIENDMKNSSTVLHTLTPLTIWVKGDFAYVHYYYNELDKNKETGKSEPSSGEWTDILMKKDGKWMLVGDHGGRTSKPSDDD